MENVKGEVCMNIDIKKLQRCQLHILTEIDRVCKKNNIEYFLAYGTCLGAVRHKGFIPWDDDIDLCMTISNFEKLKKCSKDFAPNYFFQTNETDREYGLMIARVRDSETTLIEAGEADKDINHGVFVDIYPLFSCPDNYRKQLFLIINSMLYRLFLYGEAPQNRGAILRIGSALLLRLVPDKIKKLIAQKTYRNMTKYDDEKYVTTLYGDELHIKYKNEWFGNGRLVQFEDMKVPIPQNADEYLKFTYGDYMTLPPEEARCVHHEYVLVDTENSYKIYRGEFFCKE